MQPLGALTHQEKRHSDDPENDVSCPEPDERGELPLADEVLSGAQENPVEDGDADAQAESRSLASATIHDPEWHSEKSENERSERHRKALVHHALDTADHPIPNGGMRNGGRLHDRRRKVLQTLFAVTLGSRFGEEAVLGSLEAFGRLLDDHLPLEIAELIALRVARSGAMAGSVLEVEVRDPVTTVVIDLSPTRHCDQLLAVIAALMDEDLLQKIATLVDLIGIQEHSRDLLKENPRLDLPAQVCGVEKIVIDLPALVVCSRLDLNDQQLAERPDSDPERQDGYKKLPVAHAAGAQRDHL